MIYFLGLFTDVGFSIRQAFRTLTGKLAAIIYDFIVVEYDLFVTLSKASILDNDFIEKIYNKVGLLLGIFMVFKLIFSLIQTMINPDKFNDKKNGFANIIKRSVIAIVLLGVTPAIFKMAFQVQNFVVGNNDSNNNIIYKLIIGDSVSTNVKDFGSVMASDLFFTFYTEKDGYKLDNGITYDESGLPVASNYKTLKSDIESGKSFDAAVDYLSLRKNNVYVIEFNEIFSIAVGLVVAWMLIMYTIQVAVRVVQLAYLQLIAPIPILSYISDPDGVFKKWLKQCTSTYLDLFLRVAILYFIVYLSSTVLNAIKNVGSELVYSLGDVSDEMLGWIKIFIIIGLLLFAKKAPELIKELFPSLGGAGKFSFSLSPNKVLNNTLAAGAIGGVVGAGGAMLSNGVHGYMNMKKAFKDNGGWRNIKAYGAAAVAGGKGALSVAGGAIGGAKAGLKTKDITKTTDAIKIANANREKRELKAAAGYHWYNPISTAQSIQDKVLSFAGETTGAESKIKTAEFRKDALQQTKSMQWQNFADTNAKNISSGNIDLSLLRSMQKFEENGKTVWRGIDMKGNERSFILNSAGSFVAADGGTELTKGGRYDNIASKIVTDSANIDKQIKAQGKTIKGLQTANNDAKKK